MNIKRENTEIRDHAHLMDAEGTTDVQPTDYEVTQFLASEGFLASEIDICFDSVQGFWRWSCDITRIQK